MTAFVIGAVIGGMMVVLVLGAISACMDKEPHSDALAEMRSERDLYARRCAELEETVDKLRLENARLREEEVWVD